MIPKRKPKLVALDLDGTLLDDNKQISERGRRAVIGVIERGHRVVIATGRMFESAAYYTDLMQIDVPVIACNGSVIRQSRTGEWIDCRTIDPEVAAKVIEFIKSKNIYVKAYVKDTLYCDSEWEQTLEFAKKFRISASLVENLADIPARFGPPCMLVARLNQSQEVEALGEEVRQIFAGELSTTRSGSRSLEILPAGVSKGSALRRVADLYGIPRDQILCIGDDYNDLAMFEASGFSVAMGNANSQIKARADFVTVSNWENGAALALERFVSGYDMNVG